MVTTHEEITIKRKSSPYVSRKMDSDEVHYNNTLTAPEGTNGIVSANVKTMTSPKFKKGSSVPEKLIVYLSIHEPAMKSEAKVARSPENDRTPCLQDFKQLAATIMSVTPEWVARGKIIK